MRLVLICFLLLTLGLLAARARADPNSTEPKPWSVHLDGDRATYPEQEPNDTCPGQQMESGDVINPAYLDAGNADWYTWYMNQGDFLTCGTDEVNPGDMTDTYIELYANDCSTLLAYDDDNGPGYYSMIDNFVAPYSGQYNLKVRGYNESSSGPYRFYIQGIAPPPLPNDLCSGALPLERCTVGSVNGNSEGATNDYDPGQGGCTGYPEAGKDVVYKVDLVPGDIVDMTYLVQGVDSAFYIVTDCSDVAGSCVAGADATIPPDPETIHYVAEANGTYYIILDAYGTNAGGLWTLDYSVQCAEPQACCLGDGRCVMEVPDACREMDGIPQGEGTTCETYPCGIGTERKTTTWGQIKAGYR